MYRTPAQAPSIANERKRPLPPNAEPGKCYAQYYNKQFSIDTLLIFEYTGENFNQSGIEKRSIKVAPGSTKWETKIDPNCKSTNPANCKMKCLVEIPAKYEELYEVVDTSLVKTYSNRIIKKKSQEKSDTEWLEVVCESQLTNSFFKNLKNKLTKNGYLINSIVNPDKPEIKAAFNQYQLDNNLPGGHFFVVALKHIGL